MPNLVKGFWDIQKHTSYFKRWTTIKGFIYLMSDGYKMLDTRISRDKTWLMRRKKVVVWNRTTQDTFSSLKVKILYHFHIPFFLILRLEKVLKVALFITTIRTIIFPYTFFSTFLVKKDILVNNYLILLILNKYVIPK